jgi:outer membrane protein TolC
MVDEANESYKRGFIEEMDVEQAKLNLDNLDAMIKDLKVRRLITMSWLKFAMGLDETQEIILTDNLNFFLGQINQEYLMNSSFDYNSNINYLILKKQEYLTTMQYKLSKTAYQPSLIGFLGFSEQAQRSEWSFLNFSNEKNWYEVVNWGVSLNIPIWSSGSRKFSVDKAKLNLDKVKVLEDQLKKSLNIEVKTARADFGNSYLIYLNKKQSLETSRKIYQQTVIKYRKGVVSSTDLNQKYNQFLTVEGDYTQSLLDLLKNKIRLSKILEKN